MANKTLVKVICVFSFFMLTTYIFMVIASVKINILKDYLSYYNCNEPLLGKATLVATSFLTDSEPSKARLYSKSAWSPKINTYNNFLTINLGERQMVRKIGTLGRAGTNQFVTEYAVQYSNDGDSWTTYRTLATESELFKGNRNANLLHFNVFHSPIIAQWIRIIPTRWHASISMRVELYGCNYLSDNLHFNGRSFVRYDLRPNPISSPGESIRFRFKTTETNGVLLYSIGTQGNFIALQLKDNQVVLNMDLGSNITTSMSAGRELNDDIWHNVIMSRYHRDIVLFVDQTIVRAKFEGKYHSRLDLNRNLYVGGVPKVDEGIMVKQNFSGCLENLFINATNFISEMKSSSKNGKASLYKNVNANYICPFPMYPVTFLTGLSYIRLKGHEDQQLLNVTFYFKTFEIKGLMLYHELASGGNIKIYMQNGKVKIDLQLDDKPKFVFNNYDKQFNDGNWHHLVLKVGNSKLMLSIDQDPRTITVDDIKISTGDVYNIAGGLDKNGFIGCMKLISVDGTYRSPKDLAHGKEVCCDKDVVLDSCHLIDRCNPNPCLHNGECSQNSKEFFCNCNDTGYAGAVCHSSKHPLSCWAVKEDQRAQQNVDMLIDVDGSGPLEAFPVTCGFFGNGKITTTLHHSHPQSTKVDGFDEPGSYKQSIIYDADWMQIEALLKRSFTCWQRLTYHCKAARLLNSPSESNDFRPFSWWQSRNNQPMDYWPGAVPGSRKCACGMFGNCTEPTKWCNCDAGRMEWREDSGDIREMEYLPVRAVRFGDTGTPSDKKKGRYALGPLHCEGDTLFNWAVTFWIGKATINLPRYDFGHSGDIYMEFRPKTQNAVLLHATGPVDFIQLSIMDGTVMEFQVKIGRRQQILTVTVPHDFEDDLWHTVYIEKNRKEARLVVDNTFMFEVRNPLPVRPLRLTSGLVIGANTKRHNGFIGSIRAIMLNGEIIDLRSKSIRKSMDGVSEILT